MDRTSVHIQPRQKLRFCYFSLDQGNEGDQFEVLDLAEYAKRQRWWNRFFGRNSGPIAEKYTVATQLMIGGASGW